MHLVAYVFFAEFATIDIFCDKRYILLKYLYFAEIDSENDVILLEAYQGDSQPRPAPVRKTSRTNRSQWKNGPRASATSKVTKFESEQY